MPAIFIFLVFFTGLVAHADPLTDYLSGKIPQYKLGEELKKMEAPAREKLLDALLEKLTQGEIDDDRKARWATQPFFDADPKAVGAALSKRVIAEKDREKAPNLLYGTAVQFPLTGDAVRTLIDKGLGDYGGLDWEVIATQASIKTLAATDAGRATLRALARETKKVNRRDSHVILARTRSPEFVRQAIATLAERYPQDGLSRDATVLPYIWRALADDFKASPDEAKHHLEQLRELAVHESLEKEAIQALGPILGAAADETTTRKWLDGLQGESALRGWTALMGQPGFPYSGRALETAIAQVTAFPKSFEAGMLADRIFREAKAEDLKSIPRDTLRALATAENNGAKALASRMMRQRPDTGEWLPKVLQDVADKTNSATTATDPGIEALVGEWDKVTQATFQPNRKATDELLEKLVKRPTVLDHYKVKALGAIGAPENLDGIFDYFKTMKIDSGHGERLALEVGKVLGKILERASPETQKEWAPKLAKFFLDPAIPAYRKKALRQKLPIATKRLAEAAEVAEKLKRKKTKDDPCSLVCGLAENLDKWAPADQFDKPETYFDPKKPLWTWKLATKSLVGLFLVSASPYCPKPSADDLRKKMDQWFNTKGESAKREDPEDLIKKMEGAGVTLTDEQKRSLRDFAEGKGTVKDNKRPMNNAEIYGRAFFRMLEHSPAAANPLAGNLEKPTETTHEQETNNSLMTMHLLASGVLGLQGVDSESKRAALRTLEKEVDCAKKRWGSPLALRYSPKIDCSETPEKGETPDSVRSSAPRAVLVHLALYLNAAPGKQQQERRANLAAAVTAYDDYLLDHLDLIGRDYYENGEGKTLHDVADHNMAPYFGPAASLYATAAAALLATEKGAPEEMQTEMKRARASLRDKIRADFQDDGLFKRQAKTVYSASTSYDNAQFGLALIATLGPGDACYSGTTPATGVLAPLLKMARPLSPPPAPAPRAKSH